MLAYPANFKKDGESFVVTFPDIPEAITQGEGMNEAMAMAEEVLRLSMDFYVDDHRLVPTPSKLKRGQRLVALPLSVSAKVLLLNEMLRRKVTPAELARRLKTTPQAVNRLTNLRHSTKIDAIAEAVTALNSGVRLVITTEKIAA
jgi:antitoxin HicB